MFHGRFGTAKKPMFPLTSAILQSVSDTGRNVDEVTHWIQYEVFWRYWLFFHSCRPFYRDHEKFGKSTTRFSQTFKTYHPESKQAFLGKILCVSFIQLCDVYSSYTVDQLWLKKAFTCKECEQLFSIQHKNTRKI